MRTRNEAELFFNGVNAETGEYLWPPMAMEELSRQLGSALPPPSTKGARFGVDMQDLSSAGWGIVFAAKAAPEVREALAPLIALRREQASRGRGVRFRLFAGEEGYRAGETAGSWLIRHGAGPGPVNPARVPYYLLLVGSPEEIPFAFQFELSVQHAVGRIGFETALEYSGYATSVVEVETGAARKPKRVALWAPANADDRATALSSRRLVGELTAQLASSQGAPDKAEAGDWSIEKWIGSEATKERLTNLLGGDDTPALLFTASHGLGSADRGAEQHRCQGALLTQEWPGPKASGKPLTGAHYFSAGDVGDDAQVHGLVVFLFACFGAGTPREEQSSHLRGFDARTLADRPFLARLPQRLLAHPNGGALAVVGHVDLAWGYSFMWDRLDDQVEVFRSTLLALLANYPVGAAMEAFSQRYAEISTRLLARLHNKERGHGFDPGEVLQLWTATHDAKSYVILGDPAARLAVTPASHC